MQGPLYPSEGDKLAAINNLKSLEMSGGWLECLKVLDLNIAWLLERIVTGDYINEKELEAIRQKIIAYRELKDLPQTQIIKISPLEKGAEVRDDPYSTIEDINKENAEKGK